jgi:hypothetical protein
MKRRPIQNRARQTKQLLWINFDRHALLNLMVQQGAQFIANVDDIRPQYLPETQQFLDQTAIFNASLTRDIGIAVGAAISNLDNVPLSAVSGMKELATPWYSDQILPFDITLAGTNEVGAATERKS